MTEQQFTPEYIAYMQSDEAKALQALWVPAVCDWCVATDKVAAQGLGYVARWQVPDDSGSHRTTWVVVVTPDSGTGYISGGSQARIRENFVWLPTLFQLIRVIEGAGYVWERRVASSTIGDKCSPSGGLMLVPKRWAWFAFRAEEIKLPLKAEEEDGQTLLAAAQLAVRAVEEK